ncbi:DUF1631 family protein [Ramlibacter sp.]|uniref:DUF1631 family protein n=1 Tax=Ramlibacter sp. TaxID=1917967 RepID=UPI002BCBE576|nr:DUF1631 family protein [Ramlibacter sp.]HWI84033.1 DUF1631 family protein [Ramlibacter sp.]
MSTQRPTRESAAGLARRVREQFVAQAEAGLAPLYDAIRSRLGELAESSVNVREMYELRDAMVEVEQKGRDWVRGTGTAWRQAVVPPAAAPGRAQLQSATLELIGDDVVERKIVSSRLALAIREHASWELNDLRVRMQHLEGGDALEGSDVLRPEALTQMMVEQWEKAALSREIWTLVHDVVQRALAEQMPKAYRAANEHLIAKGVLRDIDLSARVKRSAAPRRPPAPGGAFDAESTPEDGGQWADGHQDGGYQGDGPQGGGYQGGGYQGGSYQGAGSAGGVPGGGPQGGRHQGGHQGGFAEGALGGGQQAGSDEGGYGGPVPGGYRSGGWARGPQGGYGPGVGLEPGEGPGGPRSQGVADETRLMTSRPALGRHAAGAGAARRATGVLGQLKRFLRDRVAGFDGAPLSQPSPGLVEAISREQATQRDTQLRAGSEAAGIVYDDAAVQEVAGDLRRRTGELKKKASTQSEKAIIEIVALMFQSILAEERIPPAIRVWFARLQMPVLRVAIAEPEFFGSLEHPARQLIDRMGSCVMGFNATEISGSALEMEIKRVVQVIEQYPETGRRVFQLVYDEFLQFLSRFLTEKGPTQRLVTVAQQVEQKETLAVQYTIELRTMLSDIPVRDEIREFLFKVWAEVLALAAVKHGAQHEDTLSLKKCASELVWAASAKPNRSERARVIQDLPRLLQRLRHGMSLIGMEGQEQESQIKRIGDILADAFLLKTEAIPHERIEDMAERLAHLEDFVMTADSSTELPLDAESIELMLGIDASLITVVADGGSRPSSAVAAWAAELQLGHWFTLDHNGATNQVQYAWRSDRGQLHLFAAPDGRSFLLQAGRLAAYLQAGLLVPAEDEALTVRATREALAKLDANPERLLQ